MSSFSNLETLLDVNSPRLPFKRHFVGSTEEEFLIVVKGTISHYPKEFAINITNNGNILLHINPRWYQRQTVFNTRKRGCGWGREQRTFFSALLAGSTFKMEVLFICGQIFIHFNNSSPFNLPQEIPQQGGTLGIEINKIQCNDIIVSNVLVKSHKFHTKMDYRKTYIPHGFRNLKSFFEDGIPDKIIENLARLNGIKEVDQHSDEGKMVSHYFYNTQAHQFKISLTKIWKVCRKEREMKFYSKYGNKQRMLLWHGTRKKFVYNILKTGFTLPGNSEGMFGNGIYFADRATKSAQYSDGVLLLCEVVIGHCKEETAAVKYDAAPISYDSVVALGKYVPDSTSSYHGTIVPWGTTTNNPRNLNYPLNYNEYIIYDVDRVLIKYFV